MRFLTPYAARALITHKFDTDHLDIWIVFRFAMDTTVKPANNKWIVDVDGVQKAVGNTAWIDEWTMMLIVPTIASLPFSVSVAYDGPNQNLRISWLKQWEPWGPIESQDSEPLPFGSFKGNEINWQQATIQNVWYPILDADITVNLVNKMTFQNNGELKILISGFYQVTFYLTAECSIANKHVLFAPEINGAAQEMGMSHNEFGRANEERSLPSMAQFNLSVDDVVRAAIMTPDAGAPTISIDHIGMTIAEIGRTE